LPACLNSDLRQGRLFGFHSNTASAQSIIVYAEGSRQKERVAALAKMLERYVGGGRGEDTAESPGHIVTSWKMALTSLFPEMEFLGCPLRVLTQAPPFQGLWAPSPLP
jgi:hypothetical protein